MYPDYTYCLWDDKKINDLLGYNTAIKKLYDMEWELYGKADIARYVILFYYGGFILMQTVFG